MDTQDTLTPQLLLAAALGKATIDVDEELRSRLACVDVGGMLSYMLDMIELDRAKDARAS